MCEDTMGAAARVVVIICANAELTRRGTKGESHKKRNKNPIQDVNKSRLILLEQNSL